MNAVRADPKQLRTPVHRCLGQVGSGLHASGGSVWGRRRKMDNMSATVIYMRQKLTNKTKSEFHTTSASALHDPKFAYLQYAWNLDSQNVVDGPRDEYQTDAPIANVEQKYADQSLSRRQKLIAIRIGTCLETDQYKSPKPRLCRKKEQGKKKKTKCFIYGMQTLTCGPTAHARTTGIWLGMLPLYLHAGGHAYTSVQ